MAITYFEAEGIFLLETKNSTYAISRERNGALINRHFGPKITDIIDVPTASSLKMLRADIDDRQEVRAFGGNSRITPTLKVSLPDGTRSVLLRYDSHKIEENELTVTLNDVIYPLKVDVHYRVLEAFDIIERKCKITNEGKGDVIIESAYSASLHLPYKDDYRLTYLAGSYNREFQKYTETLTPGRKILESRTGLAGQDSTPFFMLDDTTATEDYGEVYYGALIWSGNWQIVFEKDCDLRTIVTGGVSSFDFEYCLEAKESYDTPIFLFGYTNGGFGNATRTLHRYERSEIIHPSERERILPIIYNTHGSLLNAACEENVMREIELAHKHGIELFVLEGGWTGYHDVTSDVNNGNSHRLGYGTWEINKLRFPRGLLPIADKIHSYGMKFGLWIEPEAVFCDNRLAKEHPEWLVGYDNREPEIAPYKCYSLNMANDDAAEYITNILINLVRENKIDYIKNDFNRYLLHLGWRNAERKHSKEAWDKYVRNMWRCYETLKKEFPNLIFENSAGGGKRGDLGMLRFSGRMHRSDNQDPLDSIKMHEGMSYFVPPKFEGGACFISDEYSRRINRRDTTMEYQAHVAMLSSVSVSLNFATLSKERSDELKMLLDLNKKIRKTVQLGDFYRIVSAYEKDYAVYEYLEEDKSLAILFILGQNMQFGKVTERARLKDLIPNARYRITGYGSYYKKGTSLFGVGEERERKMDYGVFTGLGLMNIGIRFTLLGHATSQILVVEKI